MPVCRREGLLTGAPALPLALLGSKMRIELSPLSRPMMGIVERDFIGLPHRGPSVPGPRGVRVGARLHRLEIAEVKA